MLTTMSPPDPDRDGAAERMRGPSNADAIATAAAVATRASGAVQSVDRAMHLIEILAAAPGGVGLADLARTAGLPQPTVHRLLRALTDRNWVRQESDRRYVVGAGLIGIGHSAQRLLAAGAEPYLRRAVEISGETANLAVLETDHVVYVAQAASPHRLRMFTEVGNRAPLHSTGVGKAILAFLPPAVTAAMLARTGLPRRTPTTITDPTAFTEELARVRAQGYGTDNGEEEVGVRCLAFPLLARGASVPAARSAGPAAPTPDPSACTTFEPAAPAIPAIQAIPAVAVPERPETPTVTAGRGGEGWRVIGALSVSGPAARLEAQDLGDLVQRMRAVVDGLQTHLAVGSTET
jgi:IclR family acetate operon transcriptional repressor